MRVVAVVVSRVESAPAPSAGDQRAGGRRPLPLRMLEQRLSRLAVSGTLRTLPISHLIERRWPREGARPFLLTFDGGFATHAELVLPLLLRLGLRASFFVPPERLDRRGYLSSGQLVRLLRHGMELGVALPSAQTLHQMSRARLGSYLERAKAEIEMRTGEAVRAAACLGPLPERPVLARIRSAGYAALCTGEPANHFELEGLLCVARRELLPSTAAEVWSTLLRLDDLSHHDLGFYLPDAATGPTRTLDAARRS